MKNIKIILAVGVICSIFTLLSACNSSGTSSDSNGSSPGGSKTNRVTRVAIKSKGLAVELTPSAGKKNTYVAKVSEYNYHPVHQAISLDLAPKPALAAAIQSLFEGTTAINCSKAESLEAPPPHPVHPVTPDVGISKPDAPAVPGEPNVNLAVGRDEGGTDAPINMASSTEVNVDCGESITVALEDTGLVTTLAEALPVIVDVGNIGISPISIPAIDSGEISVSLPALPAEDPGSSNQPEDNIGLPAFMECEDGNCKGIELPVARPSNDHCPDYIYLKGEGEYDTFSGNGGLPAFKLDAEPAIPSPIALPAQGLPNTCTYSRSEEPSWASFVASYFPANMDCEVKDSSSFFCKPKNGNGPTKIIACPASVDIGDIQYVSYGPVYGTGELMPVPAQWKVRGDKMTLKNQFKTDIWDNYGSDRPDGSPHPAMFCHYNGFGKVTLSR